MLSKYPWLLLFFLELDLLPGIKVIEVCLSFNIIIQGHPKEYFGKISVRMEGGLKISKLFFSATL